MTLSSLLRKMPPFMPVLIILICMFALNGLAEPNSLSPYALKGLISTYLALMFLSVGQTIVIFAADIDLSVGAILGLVNVTLVSMMQVLGGEPAGIFAAMAIALAVGAGCGLLNGILVVVLRLQAIVATFATSVLFLGLALWIMPVAGTPAPRLFWRTFGGRIAGIPFAYFVLAGLLVLIVLLSRSRFVQRLLTVGDDQLAAYQTGLPVQSIRVRGYVACGIFAALAGFCITGDTASGDPNVGGLITLNSVAAAVLGGAALSGGVGTLFGSVLGSLVIGLVGSLVFFLGTPSEWQNLAQGLTVLAALMVGILFGGKARA
ncbi:ABC transporter permease [Pseudooceanicola nitratireducens]|uniref:ABC transporter permease n=1 Tax=Pseudooceanicola nitratireducens TaxID=517719 RepID=UPI0031024B4C